MHEFAHSIVAKHYGIGVDKITLYPIGGIASMRSIPTKPHEEFFISAAGPLSNILFIAVFYLPMREYQGIAEHVFMAVEQPSAH